ncbi:MAG: hypothetical protein NVSMB29_00660 [Candidatus Dormibacteria bacterium]
MPAERRAYAFIILLRNQDDARGLARLLADLRWGASDIQSDFLVPPVTGLRFFADESVQMQLDAWWAGHVREEHLPVYLVDHEPGLAQWLAGIDGQFYVKASLPGETLPYPAPSVTTFVSEHPLEYARLVMRDYSQPPAELFAPEEAARLTHTLRHLSPAGASLLQPGGRPQLSAPPPAIPVQPDVPEAQRVAPESASSLQPGVPARARAWRSSLTRASAITPTVLLRRPSRPDASSQRLAQRMLQRGPLLVVMGSRKGGVGKTSFAAGVAIQAGQVLDAVGHTACLVDANIANPDAWGQMSLPARAATVRQVVAALTGNREPPAPIHAQTPALACYPESREGSDYSKTDVDRFAAHLRRRYTFIVVDMSNRLPDPLGGPEAAAAAYWLDNADVLVLPTTSSIPDCNGVLDYLEVVGLPPVVVPYIVSKVRLNRRHEVARAYLEAIRVRVDQVVEIPDLADKVRLAGMEKLPVAQVSPALRRAYRRLTDAVVAAPPRVSLREGR